MVVEKNVYSVGQKIVYFPPETVMPTELSDRLGITQYLKQIYHNGSNNWGKIKIVNLRREPSYGATSEIEDESWQIGDDVTQYYIDKYGVYKYEPPAPKCSDAMTPDPYFIKYTDIENLRNYPNAIEEGTLVSIYEKIHGCVPSGTRIMMANGTKKKIIDVNVGDLIIGVDEENKLTPTRVTNKFNNGKAEKWIGIKISRNRMDKGSACIKLTCTPNHKIWDPTINNYRDASTFKVGDSVTVGRYETGITPLQLQILIGKMLGDGSLHSYDNVASVHFSHKKEHIEYLQWTLKGLGDLSCSTIGESMSGYGTKMSCAITKYNYHIYEYFNQYVNNAKVVGDQFVNIDLPEPQRSKTSIHNVDLKGIINTISRIGTPGTEHKEIYDFGMVSLKTIARDG
jgi:hypothetical protein